MRSGGAAASSEGASFLQCFAAACSPMKHCKKISTVQCSTVQCSTAQVALPNDTSNSNQRAHLVDVENVLHLIADGAEFLWRGNTTPENGLKLLGQIKKAPVGLGDLLTLVVLVVLCRERRHCGKGAHVCVSEKVAPDEAFDKRDDFCLLSVQPNECVTNLASMRPFAQ